jgi:hypothetical protein
MIFPVVFAPRAAGLSLNCGWTRTASERPLDFSIVMQNDNPHVGNRKCSVKIPV